MTNKDLDSLNTLPVPPPRDTAKSAALSAALAAFENVQSAPQASVGNVRPISQSQPGTRRSIMTLARQHYALAASLAALVVAAPLAFQISQSERNAPLEIVRAPEPADGLAKKEVPKLQAEADDKRKIASEMIATDSERQRAAEVVIAGQPASAPSIEPLPTAPSPPIGPSRDQVVDLVGRSQIGVTDRPGKLEQRPSDGLGAVPQRPIGVLPYDQESNRIAQSSEGGSKDARALAPRAATNLAAPGESRPNLHLEGGEDRDRFTAADQNPIKQTAADPVSTFSVDVDTASYAFVRRALNAGRLPPQAAVRTEEMINYFRYDYPAPESATEPFKPTVTVVPSPWNATNKLVHIGIKGYDLKSTERPRANLVFLIDTSGSMAPQDHLPLVKNGLRMLVDELKPDDTVALVTYASGSGIELEPTKISEKSKILAALERLGAGGSTAGASGIEDAYRLAEANFDKSAVNRIILATDGDFNVGITEDGDLRNLIERKRAAGIFLSILGVGAGNYNDRLMQTLAQNGNGVAAYADTLNEARKVLVEEASSTLFNIAKDVKIQVEWNPARVSEYRLLGYETRALKREDFNNDKVDAGDIGSGHTVTAIYEITPVGAEKKGVDDLRYAAPAKPAAPVVAASASNELGFLKIRAKLPNAEISTPLSLAITDALSKPALAEAPADVRFATAVAGFAELLRGSPHLSGFTYDDVLALAGPARGDDPFGERSEFLNLVRLAKSAPR
jgi:Ca-activated chloride channel homolog